MDDTTKDIHLTLDLALRVGEMLLANGAGAADVTATMQSVAVACGLRGASPDVTFTQLTMTYQPHVDDLPFTQTRRVTHREIDYEDLTTVDHLVRDLVNGRIDRAEARARLLRTTSTGHARHRWAVTGGWGVMGAGATLVIGGGALVAVIGFLTATLIDRLQRRMSLRRYPLFYQQVAGAIAAAAVGVVVTAAALPVDAGRVVTAGIIMLLAGLGLVGATQDALAGFPITANARFLEALLATVGIIAGVSGGLTVGSLLGVNLGRMETGSVGFAELPVIVGGSALTAAGFAYASYAPLRSLAPIAVIAMLGTSLSLTGGGLGLGGAWATAFAATLVGFASYFAARRVEVPSLVLIVPAVVPLLPGLAIYRGLDRLAEGEPGTLQIASAAATALALAAGVILGQYIAQPLHREARRLETRLAGPRLVGPAKGVPRKVRRQAREQHATRVGER